MKSRFMFNKVLMLILFVILSVSAHAQVELPSFISDNMVLQQKFEAPIWGWSKPNTEIIISNSWDSIIYQTSANYNGEWFVKIQTPSAGGPYTLTINDSILTNILIGEVWVCSGQSNMQWALENSENPDVEIPKANYPNIRMFYAARDHARIPNKDVYGQWDECAPEVARTFSAIAYYFGRELVNELNVPIGLLHFSWGGTPAEAWTNPEVLKTTPEGNFYLSKFEEKIKSTPPGENPRNARAPGANYYGMLKPLIPFGIKGAIWYQGESNVSEHSMYRNLFETMITNWRDEWQQGDFPFYFVQLAPYNYSSEIVGAALRDAQRESLEISNTGMAVTMDIGNPGDIHPKNKMEVGRRLSLWALAKTYGKSNVVYSGPLYKSMKIEGNAISVSFGNIGNGLISKGDTLTHFTIAGNDQEFYPANAIIESNIIIVSSPQVKNPVAVRFAFGNGDEPNLFNAEGLPASTFRTDDWKINSDPKP